MFREVDLPDGVPGTLYLHSMPGRFEDWPTFVLEAERAGLDVIVCLTSASEVQSKSPAYAQARLARTLPYDSRDFPIADFSAPPVGDRLAFKDFVAELATQLISGAKVLIHCGAGIGRTGTVAACLLLELGVEAKEARRLVGDVGSQPEVPEQKELILWYSAGSNPA